MSAERGLSRTPKLSSVELAGCHWLWHCSSRHYSLWHWRAAAVLCHAGELRRTGPAALPAAPAVASFHLPGAWFDLQPSKVPCVGSQAARILF